MSTMVKILAGDARRTLRTLAPKSVHMAVTSPPYWQLRSYLPKDHADKSLEIGSEVTPAEYIANLMAVFDVVREVLRDDGTLWVNLGDTMAGGGRGGNPGDSPHIKQKSNAGSVRGPTPDVGISDLNQVGIPYLFAFAMRDRGWLWRDTIVWAKTCAMPCSVDGWRFEKHKVKTKSHWNEENPHPSKTGGANYNREGHGAEWSDCPGCEKCTSNGGLILRKGSWRTTTAHELIFMFAKTDSYFCDPYAVRTPAKDATIGRNKYSRITEGNANEEYAVKHDHQFTGVTANLRSVWEIGPEPLVSEKHFASFPSELPRRCILAGTSAKGVCKKCGDPWARIVKKTRSVRAVDSEFAQLQEHGNLSTNRSDEIIAESLGWRETCDCNAGDPIAATVLDPFGGSGRTALAAIALGRRAILCELNQDYIDIQRRQFGKHVPLFASS